MRCHDNAMRKRLRRKQYDCFMENHRPDRSFVGTDLGNWVFIRLEASGHEASLMSNSQETMMNHDQFSGQWKQLQGKVKQQWGKLTDDDLTRIEGKQDELIGRVQERYGIERAEAEKQVREFVNRH
jgi:uncharacterized protein YjbJ (UPF0337 family)